MESKEGKGTKFTFIISLKEDRTKLSSLPANSSIQIKHLSSPSLLQGLDKKDTGSSAKTLEQDTTGAVFPCKLKVLMVEDNEINRSFFSKLLILKGIDYDIAVDGQEAVEACLAKHYDFVFMDCQMPVMDGYEATRRIRQEEGNNKHTTIIAMTAYALSDDAEKSIKAGMDDYLTKPLDHHKLTEVIYKYAPKSISTKKKQKQEYIVRLMNETGFDLNTAEELIELGLVHIKNLMEEALQSLQRASYNEVGFILHQLKGSAGNLRLKEIVDLVIKANNELNSGSHEATYRTLSNIKDILDNEL